jgi:tRNA nucleotidyltransferase (CCA-adding enzyme)
MNESEMFDQQRRTSSDAAEAFRIMEVLSDAGFVAYLAGGCVRDSLLGMTPKDYDVATDATPESVRRVFGKPNTLAYGASFGVIGVLPPKLDRTSNNEAVTPTEVATFRSDGEYSDGRRPDSVHYGNAQQDALRRDFTINGLFFDPISMSVIDFVDGKDDLTAGRLRTIGSPQQRFAEDKLRMLRAVRFATTLGFQVDPATTEAIVEHAADISVVSGERIGAEMRRVMTSPHAFQGLHRLQQTGLAPHVLPGLAIMDWERLGGLLQHLPDRSFAAALACVAIASDDGKQALRQTSNRWKLSTEENRQASAAIKHHATLIGAAQLPWSVVQPVLVNRDRDIILSVAIAVATHDQCDLTGIEKIHEAIGWPPEQLDPAPLLTGDDLQKTGIPAGPQYRVLLQTVRDRQLNGEIETVDQAWKVVKHVLAEKRT